jgi:hypothetical protein
MVTPGQSELTRMLYRIRSKARLLVNMITPPFEALSVGYVVSPSS